MIPAVTGLSGGPSAALLGYVNCLGSEAEVEIATTDCGLAPKDLEEFRRLTHGVPIHCFNQWGKGSLNLSWPLSRWLRENVRNYDVVHLHALFSPMTTIAAFWARRSKIPYVIRPLGTLSPYTFSSGRRFLKRVYFKTIEKHTIQGAAATHFTSVLEMNKAREFYQAPNPVVIPNPIETRNGEKVPRNKDRSVKRILFLSRLDPKKGLDLLIPALKRAAPLDGIRLVIAGTGEESFVTGLRKRIHSEGLQNCVEWAGFASGEKKEELLRQASFFVLPSYDENFGVSVAEAMAAGLPVLVSDQVGIWPDIQEYGAGLVVRCDVHSVREGLERMIRGPSLWAEMGRRGKQLVAERYSPEKVRRDLTALYSQILSYASVQKND